MEAVRASDDQAQAAGVLRFDAQHIDLAKEPESRAQLDQLLEVRVDISRGGSWPGLWVNPSQAGAGRPAGLRRRMPSGLKCSELALDIGYVKLLCAPTWRGLGFGCLTGGFEGIPVDVLCPRGQPRRL